MRVAPPIVHLKLFPPAVLDVKSEQKKSYKNSHYAVIPQALMILVQFYSRLCKCFDLFCLIIAFSL